MQCFHIDPKSRTGKQCLKTSWDVFKRPTSSLTLDSEVPSREGSSEQGLFNTLGNCQVCLHTSRPSSEPLTQTFTVGPRTQVILTLVSRVSVKRGHRGSRLFPQHAVGRGRGSTGPQPPHLQPVLSPPRPKGPGPSSSSRWGRPEARRQAHDIWWVLTRSGR